MTLQDENRHNEELFVRACREMYRVAHADNESFTSDQVWDLAARTVAGMTREDAGEIVRGSGRGLPTL